MPLWQLILVAIIDAGFIGLGLFATIQSHDWRTISTSSILAFLGTWAYYRAIMAWIKEGKKTTD